MHMSEYHSDTELKELREKKKDRRIVKNHKSPEKFHNNNQTKEVKAHGL